MNMNRRRFVYTTAWGGTIGMAWPGFTAAEPNPGDSPILVVIHLAGGNDGLNTIVPIDNDYYYSARPKLAIKSSMTLSIDGATGVHPSLTGLKSIYDTGRVAIVEGVGYPHPNRSHFRSTEIWHTGSDAEKTERHGWIGRYFDTYCQRESASVGICVGKQSPQAFAAAMPKGVTFSDPKRISVRHTDGSDEMMKMMGMGEDESDIEASGASIGELAGSATPADPSMSPLDFLKNTASEARASAEQIEAILNKTKPRTAYPNTRFAREMQVVSQLIRGSMPTRIYYLAHGGFDTHANQLGSHAARLKEWSDAMQAFMDELSHTGQAGRVCTMVFSEFGRRVAENASGGTDHGVAGPLFAIGGSVKGGLHGRRPSLSPADLDHGDIVHTVDYRAVYATLLEKHLGVDSKPVLLKPFKPLDFLG